LNETDYFVGFRVHVPLGSVPEGRERVAGASFESRLYEMVNRDFRIRTRETGPVSVGGPQPVETVQVRSVRRTSTEEEEIPSTCTLNSEGDVVCR
jgi:hypothetical protein